MLSSTVLWLMLAFILLASIALAVFYVSLGRERERRQQEEQWYSAEAYQGRRERGD